MPWCEECAKYWTPSSMNDDGTCPQCGDVIDDTEGHVHASSAAAMADEKAPWHFKLMVVSAVVYLVWRFVGIFT